MLSGDDEGSFIENDVDNMSLIGTADDDELENYGDGVTITALGGNDSIFNDGAYVTINAGTGNDRIDLAGTAENNLIQYASGDGNDFIDGFNEDDTLQIDGTWSTQQSGSRVIVTVGDGKITLRGAARLDRLNITGTDSSTLTDNDAAKQTLASGITVGDASARTQAIYLVGNALANSMVGGSGKDSLYGKDGNDYLEGGAGNDYLNGQTGNDTLWGGEGNDTLKGDAGADTFLYTAGNDVIADFTAYDTLRLGDGTAAYSKATNGGNLILTVGNGSVTLTGAATLSNPNIVGTLVTNVTLTDSDTAKQTLKSDVEIGNASSRTQAIYLVGNALDNSILGGSGSDSIYGKDGDDYLGGGAGNDYLNGQTGNDTLAGGKGNDTLKGGAGEDVFLYTAGDGNDIIADYENGDIIKITSGTFSAAMSGDNYILTVGSNKISVVGAADKYLHIVDANDQDIWYPNVPSPPVFVIEGNKITLTEYYTADSFNVTDHGARIQTINAGAVQHGVFITANTLANNIIGSAHDDYIDGKGAADKIDGGDGNDTLVGGTGNDTLTGGDGADIFVYKPGDGYDLITDYSEEDMISITGGTVSSIAASGNNVIFTVGTHRISVAGAADKVIRYADDETPYPPYLPPVIVEGNNATLTSAYTADSFDVADYSSAVTIRNIDAGVVQHGVFITANALANNIIGSEYDDYIDAKGSPDKVDGGDGNDTIVGGTGNDTLYGGEGEDVFVYKPGDGNDVIADFTDGEVISIVGGIGTFATSGNDAIIRVGSNRITIKDAYRNNTYITFCDNNGERTYNPILDGDYDVLADDNYSATAALSEIVAPAQAQFTPYDFESGFDFGKKESFAPAISYSGDKK